MGKDNYFLLKIPIKEGILLNKKLIKWSNLNSIKTSINWFKSFKSITNKTCFWILVLRNSFLKNTFIRLLTNLLIRRVMNPVSLTWRRNRTSSKLLVSKFMTLISWKIDYIYLYIFIIWRQLLKIWHKVKCLYLFPY